MTWNFLDAMLETCIDKYTDTEWVVLEIRAGSAREGYKILYHSLPVIEEDKHEEHLGQEVAG